MVSKGAIKRKLSLLILLRKIRLFPEWIDVESKLTFPFDFQLMNNYMDYDRRENGKEHHVSRYRIYGW